MLSQSSNPKLFNWSVSYIVNEKGQLIIMQANGNGSFDEPTPPNWREYDLTKALDDMRRMIEKQIVIV